MSCAGELDGMRADDIELRSGLVEQFEPNALVHTAQFPDSPPNDASLSQQWALQRIEAEAAWREWVTQRYPKKGDTPTPVDDE